MENIEIKAAISEIGKSIDAKLSAANEAVKDGNKVTAAIKDELSGLIEKQKGYQAQLDKISTNQSKSIESLAMHKSLTEVVEDVLTKSDAYKAFQNGNSTSVSLDLKAVTVTTPVSAVQPDYAPGFFYNPARIQHAREFLAIQPTVSNIVYWIQEAQGNSNIIGTAAGFTQSAAPVAEGTLKPQSDFTLVAKNSPVIKLATFHLISTEMLADVVGITSYISTRLPNKLKYTEDAQILYGSGAGGNMLGLAIGGSAYVQIASFFGTGATKMDVIGEAILQARQAEYMANVILLNPADLLKMIATKNSQGTYLVPNIFSGSPFSIEGIPVVANTAIPPDNFIVGDFANAAILFTRQDLALRFFEQDSNNPRLGLVTIELSERIALGIVRPSALIYGTFTAALTGTP